MPTAMTSPPLLPPLRLELEGRRIISHHLVQHTLLQNYLSVLEIILRLRQARA